MSAELGPFEIRKVEWNRLKDVLNACERNGEQVMFVLPVANPFGEGHLNVVTRQRLAD